MKRKTCLYPRCTARARSRGLCKHHYNQAYQATQNTPVTWAMLEAAGKVKPPRRPVPKTHPYAYWAEAIKTAKPKRAKV